MNLDGDGAAFGAATSPDESAPTIPIIPALNVLVMGTDARPDESEATRTDTLILLMLDRQGQTAGMLSLPRDLWVSLPGFGYATKINTAYQLGETQGYTGGGAQLAKDTVSTFIGQPVPYYVRVNFSGFVELIDLIGGVDVVVEKTIHDEQYPTDDYGVQTFHLDAGTQHLDGATALKYVRTRNVDDDYSRARRQQQVIRAVADKVLRADMLPMLLTKLPRLLYTMRSSIDTDIPMSEQLDIAAFFNSVNLREVRQLVLDNRYGEETYSQEGAWILLPDRAKVRAALAQFYAPSQEGTDGAGAVALTRPETVRIEILNGTGEPGVAAKTAELLESQGWQVVAIGDADRGDYGRTIIVNYGVAPDLVKKVGSDLHLEPNTSTLSGLNVLAPVDMRIVVGRDFLTSAQ
jgi:LCP family protein required for cell wall assembly